ncbi:programmed cell death protein 2 [Chloropicon primus]|uniref:Programmed cell death protein 2 n=1 Tax=Chloropicon primus TaxID=1764295 RepID=A0A5B8MHN0_9CHLO|nr:programmed cell death protein 2 [Chloropicon primus]UPQ99350.1 programmed cell death protein 2 [Chloropicon primus]|mmetsp:Transcript_6720/g.19680  ORF Transcript_6720/g.19680 Transcript_6720/m.19680 type:complete len:334 (+) Transcript_6720:163-1164(+)|eukprot:QDZ20138.1 programmed cell death protein 2 [Chloropicon primus]
MSSGEEEEEVGGMLLGFSEEVEDERYLRRHFFPSKIGGQPAWLDPVRLPSEEAGHTKCKGCGGRLSFLLQVYAPINGIDDAFHRTLFVFTCTQEECLRKNLGVTVLRCQLGRENPYYGYHPAEDDQEFPALAPGQEKEPPETDFRGPWTESELVTDPEPEAGEAAGGDDASELERLTERYGDMVVDRPGEGGGGDEAGEDIDLNEMDESEIDEVWAKFQKRLSRAPTQCIRYCSEGVSGGEAADSADAKPLWPSSSNTPSGVPPCGLCGKPRQFEFQILPQVLYYAGVDAGVPDDLDFTTIAVYTCSCTVPSEVSGETGSSYTEEFAWTQCGT